MKAIKELIEKKTLPIERKLMQLKITLKKINNENNPYFEDKAKFDEFLNKFKKYLTEIEAEILENDSSSVQNFYYKINIKTNFYRDILNKYDKILNIEILSQAEISQKVKEKIKENNNNNDINTNNINNTNELDEAINNMRISDVRVEKFIEENYNDDDGELKTKKKNKKIEKITKRFS